MMTSLHMYVSMSAQQQQNKKNTICFTAEDNMVLYWWVVSTAVVDFGDILLAEGPSLLPTFPVKQYIRSISRKLLCGVLAVRRKVYVSLQGDCPLLSLWCLRCLRRKKPAIHARMICIIETGSLQSSRKFSHARDPSLSQAGRPPLLVCKNQSPVHSLLLCCVLCTAAAVQRKLS